MEKTVCPACGFEGSPTADDECADCGLFLGQADEAAEEALAATPLANPHLMRAELTLPLTVSNLRAIVPRGLLIVAAVAGVAYLVPYARFGLQFGMLIHPVFIVVSITAVLLIQRGDPISLHFDDGVAVRTLTRRYDVTPERIIEVEFEWMGGGGGGGVIGWLFAAVAYFDCVRLRLHDGTCIESHVSPDEAKVIQAWWAERAQR